VTSKTSLPAKGDSLKSGVTAVHRDRGVRKDESRAYREGVQDGRNATDFGVDRWAFGPHALAYGRGVLEEINPP
jgi:hypothetical protein